MGYYLPGQACLNGHKVAGDARSEFSSPRCSDCGQPTITACPGCNAFIRGDYETPGVSFIGVGWSLADYCYQCGEPYPWTKAKLNAVQELAEAIDELTAFERQQIAELMPHLVQVTPRTKPAGFKVATILSNLTGQGKIALQDLMREVAVDAGKSALGL